MTDTIAFGGVLGQVDNPSTSTLSLTNLTCSGNNRLLLVMISHGSNGDGSTVTSLTYGGASLTILRGYHSPFTGGARWSLWYLIAPTNAANQTLSATFSTTDNSSMAAIFYTGVAQSSPFSLTGDGADAVSPGSANLSSSTDGSWMIAGIYSANDTLSLDSGGSNRETALATTGLMIDSNSIINNGGSNTFGFSWSGLGGAGYIDAMMKPGIAVPSIIGNVIMY